MNTLVRVLVVTTIAWFAGIAVCNAAAAAVTGVDGLVKVKAKRVDSAWLLPGADFRDYTQVWIDPVDVSFRKDWMRNINRPQPGFGRISDEDAREIADAARSGFDEIFAQAFKDAGYGIATAPGRDVLRLSPAITDLYINAPERKSTSGARVYTVEAGEAQLQLVARDSLTGAVLGVAIDRRKAGDHGNSGINRFTWATRSSNKSDFDRLFRTWASICVKGLQDLKEHSPASEP